MGAALLWTVLACGDAGPMDPEPDPPPASPAFDFSHGTHGFVAGFADYPPAHEADYDLASGHRALPAPLGGSGLHIAGDNHSDDLFMYFKGIVEGLTPGTGYRAVVAVEIATNVPMGCAGIGGAPGESVWVKAGVSGEEPMAVMEGTDLRMDIDKGNQSRGGLQGVVLGNIANSRACGQTARWELKAFDPRPVPSRVTADSHGRAWLFFGTDSGFEGRTSLYFTRASVQLTPG